MINSIIIHGAAFKDKEKLAKGYPPQNERGWLPWIKQELEKQTILCKTPLMPKNHCPVYENWKKEFDKYNIDKNSVLIGHSAGGSFLVRYLGEVKKEVNKLILVAPSKNMPDFYIDCFKKFGDFEINEDISERVGRIAIFISDDEEYIVNSANLYHSKLGGELIYLPNRGHFNVSEFPELLEKILE